MVDATNSLANDTSHGNEVVSVGFGEEHWFIGNGGKEVYWRFEHKAEILRRWQGFYSNSKPHCVIGDGRTINNNPILKCRY